MEAEIAIRWLFNPYSTAIAAGALVAFCLALWNKKRPKRRRNSAPETGTRLQEPESEKSGLVKSKSECSFRAFNDQEDFPQVNSLFLTNFPAFDGKPIPSTNRLPCIAKLELRPFSFSDDLIQSQRKFSRLQSITKGFSSSNRRNSCSLPNFSSPTKFVSRRNAKFLGCVYPQLQSFVKADRPFRRICDWNSFPLSKSKSTYLNNPEVPSISRNFVKDYTSPCVAKSILSEDFYSYQGINFGLRKRKKFYSFSELCWKGAKTFKDTQTFENAFLNNSENKKDPETIFICSKAGENSYIFKEISSTKQEIESSKTNINNVAIKTNNFSECVESNDDFEEGQLKIFDGQKPNIDEQSICLELSKPRIEELNDIKDNNCNECLGNNEFNIKAIPDLEIVEQNKSPELKTEILRMESLSNNYSELESKESESESDSDNTIVSKLNENLFPKSSKEMELSEKKQDRVLQINFFMNNPEFREKNKIFFEISELNSKGEAKWKKSAVVMKGESAVLNNCQNGRETTGMETDTYDTEKKTSINSNEKHHKVNLEARQKREEVMMRGKGKISFALETEIGMGPNSAEGPIKGNSGVTDDCDVTREVRGKEGGREESRTSSPSTTETHEAMNRSVEPSRRLYESSVTSETRFHSGGGVSTAVVSSMTLDSPSHIPMSVRTVVSSTSPDGVPYRPNFEEYMPVPSEASLEETIKELNDIAGRPLVLEESPPRVSRLLGLLNRDEERKTKAQELLMKKQGPGSMSKEEDGEWDRILRDVLASVSELEKWSGGAGGGDVTAEDAEKDHPTSQNQSHSSLRMEETVVSPTKGETPTKVKNLRFKLDPDIFDVPSDDSFYDDDEEDMPRTGWRKQTKYRVYEVGKDEPVKLVSVHASVVPAGQKMVTRPVGIDLRVRLTEERHSKRAHVGTSPSQAKRRSPVTDTRWCQELSPVTENVDWRESFSNIKKEKTLTSTSSESKPMPNGILKTPSPKTESMKVMEDSSNPFKGEVKLTNGNSAPHPEKRSKPPLTNGAPWKPPPPLKKLSLPRKKFEPDPEAIDRITGYKIALSKPPLPPPVVYQRSTSPMTRNRVEMARKQYLDSKNALSIAKTDGTRKFQQFLSQAQSDRARIVSSVPDLAAIEKAVNERWAKERGSASPRESPARDECQKLVETPSSRGSTPDDAWSSYVQSCRKMLGRRSQSMSYLETEVDLPVVEDDDKWRSTSALAESDSDQDHPLPVEDSDFEQSREDLDDSGRAKSEHELRVQRSLQSLPLPDWYKSSDKPKSGFLLKSSEKEKRGWAAAKSLASSTSSLASCGVRKPIHSLRSSRENIPWSRGSASPDGPSLSLALAKAFREPYLGWRSKTSTSSGVSSSPRTSPPSSWCAATTDDEANGVSFDGEDAFGRTSSEDGQHDEPPSLDDTGADAVTVSMDTGDIIKLPSGEDTCDDINNMSMDTCELFDAGVIPDVDVDETSPQADTGDSIDNLSTDTTEHKKITKSIDSPLTNRIKKEHKLKRYSYSQSIYHSEWEDVESRGDRKARKEERDPSPNPNSDPKVIWIESSFVGSRTTTSIVVLPEDKDKTKGNYIERPASR